MADAFMQGGGGISKTVYESTTAVASDVKSGKTFISGGKTVKTGTFAAESKTAYPYNARQSVTPSSGKYLSSVTIPAVKVKTGYVYIAGANTTSAETTIDLGGTYKILSVSGFGFRASTGYATFIKDVKINDTVILSETETSNGIVQWSSTQGNGVTGRYIKFKGRTNGGGYMGYVGIVVTYC